MLAFSPNTICIMAACPARTEVCEWPENRTHCQGAAEREKEALGFGEVQLLSQFNRVPGTFQWILYETSAA